MSRAAPRCRAFTIFHAGRRGELRYYLRHIAGTSELLSVDGIAMLLLPMRTAAGMYRYRLSAQYQPDFAF